jgi:hypothetical protein
MPLEAFIKQRVIPLTANVLVITLFSHSLISRTPFRLEFSRWNVILRLRTATFALVILEQTSDFINIILNDLPSHPTNVYLTLWFISVICVWTVGVLLLFASLYRYERLVP